MHLRYHPYYDSGDDDGNAIDPHGQRCMKKEMTSWTKHDHVARAIHIPFLFATVMNNISIANLH